MGTLKELLDQLLNLLTGKSHRTQDDEERNRRLLVGCMFFLGLALVIILIILMSQLPIQNNDPGPDFVQAPGVEVVDEPEPDEPGPVEPEPDEPEPDEPEPGASESDEPEPDEPEPDEPEPDEPEPDEPEPDEPEPDEPEPVSVCGDGICDPSVENSDLCSDCACVDDGACLPGEGIGCMDCGETAGTCNAVCSDTSQCAAGYTCAGDICWSDDCAAEPVEPEVSSSDDDEEPVQIPQ